MLTHYLKRLMHHLIPLHLDCIQVEVSAVCNASCSYCATSCYKDQWTGGLMDTETFERLEPSFGMADLVFLQGWGEPLLHPRFWPMVQKVKSSGAKVGFTTNGTLLNVENRSKLLDSQVDVLGISLAGMAPAIHDRLRKGCDFARIDEAMLRLKKMRHARKGEGPTVHLAFMLLRSNWQELEVLPELARKWGVSQIVVSNLNLIGSAAMEAESLLVHPKLWPEVAATLQRAKEEATARGIELHYHIPDLEKPCAVCTENILRTCFISYQGDVSPCVMTNLSVRQGAESTSLFRSQAYPLENYIFGNINEKSLREIWDSEKARRFRADFRKRTEMKDPGLSHLEMPCRHCYKLLER